MLGLDKDELTNDLLLTAAIQYFERGRLSSGAAAELAGISRLEFLKRLKAYQVSVLHEDFDALIEDYHHA